MVLPIGRIKVYEWCTGIASVNAKLVSFNGSQQYHIYSIFALPWDCIPLIFILFNFSPVLWYCRYLQWIKHIYMDICRYLEWLTPSFLVCRVKLISGLTIGTDTSVKAITASQASEQFTISLNRQKNYKKSQNSAKASSF